MADRRDSSGGFAAARRLIELAEAVRADPALPRAALAQLLARHGERPEELAPEVFTEEEADELRAAVRRMAEVLAETDEDRAAGAVNALLEECATRPRLTRHDGHPWHLHVDRGDGAHWGSGSWPPAPSSSPSCSPNTGASSGAPAPRPAAAGSSSGPVPAVPAATAPRRAPREPG